MHSLTRTLTASAALALMVTMSACSAPAEERSGAGSSASAPSAQTTVNTNAPLYSKLPDDIKAKGKIVLGSETSYPPMEYFAEDGVTILGLDKELSDLMSTKLGVPIVWQNTNFDGLVTQLDSGRIDVMMAGMSDTAERQEKADFVDYFVEKSSLMVKDGNPDKITSLADTCGKKVSVQRGTSQEEAAMSASEECTKQGKQAIDVLTFDTVSDAVLQLKNGRAAASVQGAQLAKYTMDQQKGQYQLTGEPISAKGSNYVGIGIAKKNPQLRDAMAGAMQAIIDDGSYATTMNKYGVSAGKLDKPVINGATHE